MAINREKIEDLTKNLFQDWKSDADRLSAEETKAKYIEPMLRCLGWDARRFEHALNPAGSVA